MFKNHITTVKEIISFIQNRQLRHDYALKRSLDGKCCKDAWSHQY